MRVRFAAAPRFGACAARGGAVNPKHEVRNSKQYQNPNAQMTKTKTNRGLRGFCLIIDHELTRPIVSA